jgi:hypothetical protein
MEDSGKYHIAAPDGKGNKGNDECRMMNDELKRKRKPDY